MAKSESKKKRTFGLKEFILLAVILAITFAAFSPVLQAGFINWDDHHFILDNPSVLTFDRDHIIDAFKRTYVRVYVPLSVLTWALEHHFFGFNPFVFHLNNLLLHLGVTALVFIFGRRLGLHIYAAAAAALLYGVHPVHVESVAWATERKDVLFGFFYMLSLNSYWSYIQKDKKSSYILSIIFGLLSILSKPTALSLPLVFFVLDWFARREIDKKFFLDKIPHVMYIIPIMLMTFVHHTEITVEVIPGEELSEAIPIFFWSVSFYIKAFLWPFHLIPQYQLPRPISITQWPYITAVLIFGGYVFLLVRYRKNRWFIFSFLFFLVSIFFFFRYGTFVRYSDVVADRHMYMPSVGLCLFAGWFFYELFLRAAAKGPVFKSVVIFVLIGIFVSFAVKSFSFSQIWKDSLSYWSYVIDHNESPISQGLAYSMRGYAYLEEKHDWDKAIADSDQALLIHDHNGRAYMVRGMAKSYKGNNQSALEDMNEAILYKPSATTYINRANIYIEMGRLEKAIHDADKALKSQDFVRKPNFAKVYAIRGKAYGLRGDYERAIKDLSKSIYLNPYDHLVYYDRGFFLNKQGKRKQAIADYTQALALKSDDFLTLDQRGTLYYLTGAYKKAQKDFNKALSINPDYARGYNNRGSTYLAQGQLDQALRDFNKAISIDPNYALAYLNRSTVFNEQKKWKQALHDALTARSLGVELEDDYIQNLQDNIKE